MIQLLIVLGILGLALCAATSVDLVNPTYRDKRQAHLFPAKEVVGCAHEIIDFYNNTLDQFTIKTGDVATVKLAVIPANVVVEDVKLVIALDDGSTPTAPTAVTSCTVGDASDADGWITAAGVLSSAAMVASDGAYHTAGGKLYSTETALTATITNSTGTDITFTRGKIHILMQYKQI